MGIKTKLEVIELIESQNGWLTKDQIKSIVPGPFREQSMNDEINLKIDKIYEGVMKKVFEICKNNYLPEIINKGDYLCYLSPIHDEFTSGEIHQILFISRFFVVQKVLNTGQIIGETESGKCMTLPTGESAFGLSLGYLTGWGDPNILEHYKERALKDKVKNIELYAPRD